MVGYVFWVLKTAMTLQEHIIFNYTGNQHKFLYRILFLNSRSIIYCRMMSTDTVRENGAIEWYFPSFHSCILPQTISLWNMPESWLLWTFDAQTLVPLHYLINKWNCDNFNAYFPRQFPLEKNHWECTRQHISFLYHAFSIFYCIQFDINFLYFFDICGREKASNNVINVGVYRKSTKYCTKILYREKALSTTHSTVALMIESVFTIHVYS